MLTGYSRRWAVAAGLGLAASIAAVAVHAQNSTREIRIVPSPAGKVEHLLYEDAHLQLVEIVYLPGSSVMERDSMPSVSVYDAAMPKMEGYDLPGDGHAPPPKGREYPTCSTSAPQPPHRIVNEDSFPLHVYRIEYKRIDGQDFATNWKTWYPWMLDPIKPVKDLALGADLGPPASPDFPYPMVIDSYKAAPNNHTMHYQDGHVRFLEVVIRPGERENLHGHPYPSVFEYDVWSAAMPVAGPRQMPQAPIDDGPGTPGMGHTGPMADHKWDSKSPRNGQDRGVAPPPEGLQGPACSTMGPQDPHSGTNGGPAPQHFYRLEFVHADGDAIKTDWKRLYPWIALAQAHPSRN